jgi:hypothetical protein
LINFDRGSGEGFAGGALIGPLSTDSAFWNAGTDAAGSLAGLVDNLGAATSVDVQWQSANTWGNNDGTADDEHRLSVGYLDDGDGTNGDGKGVLVNLVNVPYGMYRVYGLFASDQNGGGSAGMANVNVNGTWVLGGNATTTASAWGSITANQTAHGEYWTEVEPGVVQGNYWTVETTGATCTITGELRDGSNRGSLTGLIIEEIPDNDGDGIPDPDDPDDDNDGIPDTWEIAHFLNPWVDDKAEDPDMDAFDNEHEYVADTHPQEQGSYQTFSIELAPVTHSPIFRFRTSANRRYAIERRDSWITGSWQDLDPAFPGSGSDMTVDDPTAGPKRYYRLRVEVP